MGGDSLKGPSENEVIRNLKLLCRDHPVCLRAFFLTPDLTNLSRLPHMMPLKP